MAGRISKAGMATGIVTEIYSRCGRMSQRCDKSKKSGMCSLRSSRTSIVQCGSERFMVIADRYGHHVERLEKSNQFDEIVVYRHYR